MARESVVDETGTSVETEGPTVEVASEVAPEDTTATGILLYQRLREFM